MVLNEANMGKLRLWIFYHPYTKRAFSFIFKRNDITYHILENEKDYVVAISRPVVCL